MGPLRERILLFEGTDWCCRQAALYITHIMTHVGYPAAMLEGPVEIIAQGAHNRITLTHAWTVIPSENLIIDLTITQANWILSGQGVYPISKVEPIWGTDPPYVARQVTKIWTQKSIRELMFSEHYARPGYLYGRICADLYAAFQQHTK